jgi:alkylation response protein AidB-like acyl-CoA dehydrogenase
MTSGQIREQATAFARELSSQPDVDLARTWAALRATEVPFTPILFRDAPETAHALCNGALRVIGKANMGVAYALENHLYVLGALETYAATHPSPALRSRLDDILARRHYVANTHSYVHTEKAFTEGIRARKRDGDIVVTGQGHFVSFATTADLLFLTLGDAPDPIALLFPLEGDRRIMFGADYYFPDVLRESDTRTITCNDVVVPDACALDIARDHLLPGGAMASLQLGWHLSLSASVFLGGASYVADQTLQFVKSFKAYDGRRLAVLDDTVATLGKIGILYDSADALIANYSRAVASAGGLRRAEVANCQAADAAEEIARHCRRLIGTRVFGTRHTTLARVMTELQLGPLAPRNNGVLEKDIGRGILAANSFDAVTWTP